jgi:hypothetical protein
MLPPPTRRNDSEGGSRTLWDTDVSDGEDNEERVDGTHWRDVVTKLERDNRKLKSQVLARDRTVAALQAEVEDIRMDLITRSQKTLDCDDDLYKRIVEYTKQTLFRHVKFITGDAILNDLECKTSLANITMNHFGIDIPDRISWWKAYHLAVSDTIGTHRNQVNQALKAQVLSK